MATNRRQLMLGVATTALTSALCIIPRLAYAVTPEALSKKPYAPPGGPRSRLIFVNDLSGDIDGLFAAVHAVLSPTSQLRAIVGTGTGRVGETAQRSGELAREILALMKNPAIPAYEGAAGKLTALRVPIRSPGTQAIIDEALRTDTSLPLFIGVGGGLTDLYFTFPSPAGGRGGALPRCLRLT